MESPARSLPARPLVVVGDADGSLVAALGREGARASGAALHELGRQAGSHLVIVGKAAVDGGKHAIAQAPAGVEATVVLPRAAAAARMAACALGARVVEPAEPAQLARAVIESLDAPPVRALGWTDLGSLLDATGERVALLLRAERSSPSTPPAGLPSRPTPSTSPERHAPRASRAAPVRPRLGGRSDRAPRQSLRAVRNPVDPLEPVRRGGRGAPWGPFQRRSGPTETSRLQPQMRFSSAVRLITA